MASTSQCLASLVRLSIATATRRPTPSIIPKFLLPSVVTPSFIRHASGSGSGGMRKRAPKKKKAYKTFRSYDQSDLEKYSLCDAMRYLRAFEVGQAPHIIKYEVHVKLKAAKNGPVVRNRIRFPFAVKSDTRIGVICPEDSPMMEEARQLGAVAMGEESLFESIRAGNFPFNKLICHTDSKEALKKANVGKLLGPKGMMPSERHGTITSNLKTTIGEMIGSDEYRERDGVVRMAIGQLGFSPQMLADNLKAVMESIKRDMDGIIEDGHPKSLDEVVLSTTHGPAFSLDGKFNPTDEKIQPQDLQSAM
ncbi:60S ribosomal protein L1, mitochondrial precursor [Lasiosphaeris hirsuta]|uniref:60S ribosomal protein L1, mitochondrial n=1 Tax=Lasiosphaeris hirsuta TaxID=260670 RepID=A0AA40AQE7_9PEZI|nr:60S ribosomal protein L1, mitochondrial precursor [Lasiosphaeris hirsuta]